MEAIYRIVYSISAGLRGELQAAVMRWALEQAIMDIAVAMGDGEIGLEQAMARLARDLMRVETMFLALSFPLEERMN